MASRTIWLFIIISIQALTANGKGHYVSTTATTGGDGSFGNPWQLQTALNHPTTLLPGDTVWIIEGVYANTFDAQTSFSCKTNGTANAPIIFRNYKYKRVTIDGELTYSLAAVLGNCSYTWFWGIEITNSHSTSRNKNITGGVYCTAENMKFINMIVHDTGTGIDLWKTSKNSETYGCIIYHIGNNLLNGTNWEGHGHGMYLQNDTFGVKNIHNNIVFSTYGYGIKVWQTTTTAPIGNFDIRGNIVFNGGSASENLGGVGNNSRTHNFFVVSNGPNNPVVNTTIKNNYTYSGLNMPRPPVNSFGLNYGVVNTIIDSNVLTCQTRLGFNNTPIFQTSFKGNKVIGGIPSVYGVYLWGFTMTDYPDNTYVTDIPTKGLEYFVIPNKFEKGSAHLAIYNWDSAATVQIDASNSGLMPGEQYELVNVMDFFNDIQTGTFKTGGMIDVPMTGHSFVYPVASSQIPASQFPKFGAFLLRKKAIQTPTGYTQMEIKNEITISPNPSNGRLNVYPLAETQSLYIYNVQGELVYANENLQGQKELSLDLSCLAKGFYVLRIKGNSTQETRKVCIQ